MKGYKYFVIRKFYKALFSKINMGIALIKMKMMPSSPEVDFEGLKEEAKKVVEDNKGTKVMFEEVPIAFGLKALVVGFEQNEDEGELDPIENSLNAIENVSSVEIVDMRRAFG